jgi:hypothetical protein
MAATTATPVIIKKEKRPKFTFMLHDPEDMTSLGKFVSTDFRYAALKVASRGHTNIVLRKTNSKECREFRGDVLSLDEPQQIRRGERVIVYKVKPIVKFLRKWVWEQADDAVPEPAAAVDGAADPTADATADATATESAPADDSGKDAPAPQ